MLYLRMAWRNIWRHKSRTTIVVVAVAVSLMLMTVFQGYVSGMDEAIYGNAIKLMGGNIHVHGPGYADDHSDMPMIAVSDHDAVVATAMADERVQAVSRRVTTGGMVASRQGTFAVQIIGVEPEQEVSVSVVGQHIAEGRNLTLDDGDVALIGRGLADMAEVGVDDRITVLGRDAHNQMRQRTMTVIGIYDLNMPDLERGTVYVSLQEAGRLYLGEGQATEVVVWTHVLDDDEDLASSLAEALPHHEVASWWEKQPALAEIVAIWNIEVEVVGLTMLGITAIGTLNLMLMAVFERTREIGVLAALGLKSRHIQRLFLLEGALLGAIGGVIGLVLGVAWNMVFGLLGYDLSAYVDMMEAMALIGKIVYPSLGLEDAALHVGMAVLISVLASLYPARQAARREPAVALHYV